MHTRCAVVRIEVSRLERGTRYHERLVNSAHCAIEIPDYKALTRRITVSGSFMEGRRRRRRHLESRSTAWHVRDSRVSDFVSKRAEMLQPNGNLRLSECAKRSHLSSAKSFGTWPFHARACWRATSASAENRPRCSRGVNESWHQEFREWPTCVGVVRLLRVRRYWISNHAPVRVRSTLRQN
jgi:hypothetical protein